jgi:AcrR family transcriptional regulator
MLKAARQVFAEHGADAPLDLIARTAGVGRATQHRHFPSREALLGALFEENLDELDQVADEAEPDEAYIVLLRMVLHQLRRDRGFIAVGNRQLPDEVQKEIGRRFRELLVKPLRRAQRAGRVRRDLKPDDTLMLVGMLSGAVGESAEPRADRRIDRALEIVLHYVTDVEAPGTSRSPRKRAA